MEHAALEPGARATFRDGGEQEKEREVGEEINQELLNRYPAKFDLNQDGPAVAPTSHSERHMQLQKAPAAARAAAPVLMGEHTVLPVFSTVPSHHPSSAVSGSRVGSSEALLNAALKAQDTGGTGGMFASYKAALNEITAGRKSSHWIWYVWPAHDAVRPKSSQRQFHLPHASAALDWLRHPVLGPRFLEITTAAVGHLERGVQPKVLFGSQTDVEKFHECTTLFAIVAESSAGDAEIGPLSDVASVCRRALARLGKGEHPVAARVTREELGTQRGRF